MPTQQKNKAATDLLHGGSMLPISLDSSDIHVRQDCPWHLPTATGWKGPAATPSDDGCHLIREARGERAEANIGQLMHARPVRPRLFSRERITILSHLAHASSERGISSTGPACRASFEPANTAAAANISCSCGGGAIDCEGAEIHPSLPRLDPADDAFASSACCEGREVFCPGLTAHSFQLDQCARILSISRLLPLGPS